MGRQLLSRLAYENVRHRLDAGDLCPDIASAFGINNDLIERISEGKHPYTKLRHKYRRAPPTIGHKRIKALAKELACREVEVIAFFAEFFPATKLLVPFERDTLTDTIVPPYRGAHEEIEPFTRCPSCGRKINTPECLACSLSHLKSDWLDDLLDEIYP